MRYPLFQLFFVSGVLACILLGCGGSSGGSSQGFFGTNADCGIGGTSEDPTNGTQFQDYTFTISGTASGTIDPITGEQGPRPDNFLVFQELVMPAGLRLEPGGATDASGVEVIGSPWAAGFQTIQVLAADADNESCFTTFTFTIFVEECDLALNPGGTPDDPTPVALAAGTVGSFYTQEVSRDFTFSTDDQITVFLTTEFFDDSGVLFDPFTEFPVPGLTVSIPANGEDFPPLLISGTPTTVGSFNFSIRLTASAVDSDPALDPGACVIEEFYLLEVTSGP